VTGLHRYRAVLAAAVAGALLGGLALTSLPTEYGAPAQRQPPVQSAAPPSTGPSPAAAAAPTWKLHAVSDLLLQRSHAVLVHDKAAFMATVDPRADPRFRVAQQRLFDNVSGVPLREWSYPLDVSEAINPGELTASGAPADELWAPRTELRYAIDGVDATTTSKPAGYLYARRGQHWYLNSDTALDRAGVRTWRGPWDYGPCQTFRTGHGVVIAHPQSAREAQRVAAVLDSAIRSVTDVWGPQWPQRVGVLVPGGPGEMRSLVGNEFAVESIAAVAIAGSSDIRAHTAAGQRVVFNPDGIAKLSDLALQVVLRHEITHVAARAYTVDGAPMWMLEGYADYVGYRDSELTMPQAAPDLAMQVRDNGPPAALPADSQFSASSGQLELAYQEAWSMNAYLAQRLGEPGLTKLYRGVAGAGRVSDGRLDQILRSATGEGVHGLVAGWQRFLRQRLG
jgi:hypothetical protein